jgi:hypothetical protein
MTQSLNPPKLPLSEFGPGPLAIAKRFYEAYLENSNGLNFRGEPCPCWKELNDDVKAHWCAVAVSAIVDDSPVYQQPAALRVRHPDAAMVAKFWVESVDKTPSDSGPNLVLKMRAASGVGAEENASWSKWTPAGELRMQITNPHLTDAFAHGEHYLIEFRKA